MNIPSTLQDLEEMIANRVEESLYLDYKDSRALTNNKAADDLAKDVSAFANADGGCLIYGIREENHLPKEIDGGVPNTSVTREWIEQIITSNISPRVESLRIHRIAISETHSAFCIEVPKSYRGPHQDRKSKSYYKRHNFKSLPMEDYEITDIRSRARSVIPLVNFDVETRHGSMFLFAISNHGDLPAQDVRFEFSPPLKWDSTPPLFIENGIRSLAPKQTHRMFYGTTPQILGENPELISEFTVAASYHHPGIDQRIVDSYSINLNDYQGTWGGGSPVEELARTLKTSLQEIKDEMRRINQSIDTLTGLVGPSGLQISVRSLRELVESFGQTTKLQKRKLGFYDYSLLQEVMGIDSSLAQRILNFLSVRSSEGNLEDIEGITPEMIEHLHRFFIIPESRTWPSRSPSVEKTES